MDNLSDNRRGAICSKQIALFALRQKKGRGGGEHGLVSNV